MITIQCLKCGGEMHIEENSQPRLCPFCGNAFTREANPLAPSPLDQQLANERSPKKKYALINAALTVAPDDFAANRALLFHGRLHEPMRGKGPDFSIIKCHLFSVFETPDMANASEMLDELLRGPQLQKTMALSPNADVFFEAYLRRLATEYVDLFLRGSSRYNRGPFGFPSSAESVARRCAEPVNRMLENIYQCEALDGSTRALLLCAVRDGYAHAFPGYAEMLQE